MEELPHVLWTYRTMPRRSTGETPFSMTYGAEKSLDLIEERWERVMVQLAYYQHTLKQGYDAKVKPRPLEPGELVLRKVLGTAKNPA